MTVKTFFRSCVGGDQLPQKSTAVTQLQNCSQPDFETFFLELSLLWLLMQEPHSLESGGSLDRDMKLQFSTSEDDR